MKTLAFKPCLKLRFFKALRIIQGGKLLGFLVRAVELLSQASLLFLHLQSTLPALVHAVSLWNILPSDTCMAYSFTFFRSSPTYYLLVLNYEQI